MPVRYPLEHPILLRNIPRSTEERRTICKADITFIPLFEEGVIRVCFKKGGNNVSEIHVLLLVVTTKTQYSMSRFCDYAFQALHHQWIVYVNIVSKFAVEVAGNRADPKDLQLYTSVVAYLKDVMVAFQEETEAAGNNGGHSLLRSARLDFHYALTLSGGKFTQSNYRKMQKKFNVKWTDFLTGVNIPQLVEREYSVGDGHY